MIAVDGAGDLQLRDDQVRLGLWMFLATVTMLFAAFISAYIVRVPARIGGTLRCRQSCG